MIPTLPITPSARLERLLGYLREDPHNAPLQHDAAALALEEGAFDVAARIADAALTADPDAPAWLNQRALVHIARREYDAAEALLAGLEARLPGHAEVACNRALVAWRSGRLEDALALLAPLLARPPEPGTDPLALALRCLHAAVRPGDAVALFEQHAATGHASAQSAGVAALAALDMDRFDLAAAWSAPALRAWPDQLEALVAAASVALNAHDAETAIGLLQHALDVQPGDGRTESALGMAFMLRMDLPLALRHFGQAVLRMPAHIGTWHGMGWCQLMLGQHDAATASFEQAIALDRNFGESYGGLAVVLASQGRTQEAQERIALAERLDPGNVSARYAQAVLSGEARDVERFGRMAERVLGKRTTSNGTALVDIVLQRRR